MNNLIQGVIDYFFKVRETGSVVLEPALPWIKVIAVLLSAFFLWGAIYSIVSSGYVKRKYDELSDVIGVGHVGKRRQLRLWKKILRRIKSNDTMDWKKAVIEADSIFDEILKMSGYRGKDIHERFQQLNPVSFSNYEKILAAHKVRDRILQELDFNINKNDTATVIQIYEQAFKELGLLE